MASAPSPSARPSNPIRSGHLDRRVLLASAALLAVAIIGGVALVTASVDTDRATNPDTKVTQGTTPTGAPCLLAPADGSAGIDPDPDCAAAEEASGARIIARPNSGKAPSNPGDRGGWEQLGLLGIIIAAMAGIGLVVFRGGRRARAGRAAWQAAAAAGVDGTADGRGRVNAGGTSGPTHEGSVSPPLG